MTAMSEQTRLGGRSKGQNTLHNVTKEKILTNDKHPHRAKIYIRIWSQSLLFVHLSI